MRLVTKAALAVVLLLALPSAAIAQDESSGDSDDRVVITGGLDLGPAESADNVVVVDGDVLLIGRVTGDVVAFEGDVRILGEVEGDVTTFAGKTIVGPGATVDGDLIYGDERPEVSPRAQVGGEVRDEDWDDIGDAPWAIIGAAALWLAVTLSLLVAGVALVAIFPRAAEAVQAAARSQVWLTVALGLAAVIGLPLVAALAVATLVGIPLAIVIGLAIVPLWALGYLTCSYVLGRAIVNESPHPILAFLAGFGILRAVALIPVVGALAWIPAVVIGLGALIVAAMPNGDAAPSSAS